MNVKMDVVANKNGITNKAQDVGSCLQQAPRFGDILIAHTVTALAGLRETALWVNESNEITAAGTRALQLQHGNGDNLITGIGMRASGRCFL